MMWFYAYLPVLIVIAVILLAIYRELSLLNRRISQNSLGREGVSEVKTKRRRAARLTDEAKKWLSTRGVNVKEVG